MSLALWAMASLLASWLSWVMAGHNWPAKGVFLPIEADRYYRTQAAFAPFVLLIQGAVYGAVVSKLRPQSGSVTEWAGALAPGLYGAMIVGLWLPDLIVVECWGPAALARAMRYYAPVVVIVALTQGARTVRRRTGAGWGRAAGLTVIGLVAQAAVGGLFLR